MAKKTSRITIRITEENAEFLSQFKNATEVVGKALDRFRREVTEIQNMKRRIEISKENEK
jgi:hypothetical protein